MNEGSSSPLERMVEAFLRDKREGRQVPARLYLELFETNAEASPSTAESASLPDAALETVGPYRLLDELGRGGQGTVWLAEDQRLPRRVALKILDARGPLARIQFERFRREAAIAARLDHPNLCTVFETGLADGTPFIAMQLADGKPLSRLIVEWRARRTTGVSDSATAPERDHPSFIMALVEECARALHAAHEVGVVHRDVKPANIMVNAVGRPLLLDFGLARDNALEEGLTQTGDVFGTPAYMAPEQILGTHRADPRVDVWGLGVTLFEALMLERPFVGTTRRSLYQEICEGTPGPLRRDLVTAYRDLDVVVRTALEKEPDRRYRTAHALAEDLKRVRERRPILARPPGPLVRCRRWMQRNPVLAAATGALALTLSAGLIVALILLREARTELRDYESLRAGREAQRLVNDAEDLWPAVPARVGAMETWLSDAGSLMAGLPAYRARLASLRAGGGPDEAFRGNVLAESVRDLESLAALENLVRDRVRTATSLHHASIESQREAWATACAALYGNGRSPRALEPQLGLVPLGPDPKSGLQEFAHLLSGEAPRRTSEGALEITNRSGIVLVFLPGGRTVLGNQSHDPDGPNFVPSEGLPISLLQAPGVREVEVAPCFVSKYEVTQSQYLRIMGKNPSLHQRGDDWELHPVERISWAEASTALARWGLALPTEDQWEHAARGGTPGAWWTGNDRAAAVRASVTATPDASRAREMTGPVLSLPRRAHGPVFSGPANAFGLHGVIGNVSEWCADSWTPPTVHESSAQEAPSHRVKRGGDFGSYVDAGCSAARTTVVTSSALPTLGMRPVRPLDPPR